MNYLIPIVFVAFAILQAPFFETYFYLGNGFNALYAKVHDPIDTAKLIGQTPLNSQNCRVLGLELSKPIGSAEDLFVDPLDDNLVYFAAGNGSARSIYFPPSNHYDYKHVNPRDNSFYVFDVKNEKFTELKLTNYLTEDLVLHGMYVRVDPKDPEFRLLYFVNHHHSGSVISLFRHKVGSKTLTHVFDVADPLIHTPNAVIAVNDTSLYVTNDHLFLNGPLRTLEETTGPWRWTSVLHCHFNTSNKADTNCDIVARDFSYANGLNFDPESNTVVVADSRLGDVTVLKRSIHSKDLEKQYTIPAGTFLDNLSINKNGDFILAAIPSATKFWAKTLAATDKAVHSPIGAFIIRKSKGYKEAELVFYDDGAKFSGQTSMSYIASSHKLIGGSVIENGLLVCSADI